MNKIIETEIGSIEYSVFGSGQPVLFLHGGHSNSNETLFQKGYDKSKYQLITPSRPGYGKTPLSRFKSPKESAELIITLLDSLKIEKAILVGISAGGLTALELASNYPDRTEKLILISAVTKKWLTKRDDLYRRGKKMFSPSKEKRSWSLFRFFFKLLPKLMTKVLFKELSTKEKPIILTDEIAEIREMTFKQGSGFGFENDLDQDISNGIIEKIKCPTLILHSENDKSVNIEMAKYANQKIGNSELKTFDNKWGHLLWVGEESAKPIADVIKFLNE
ncbi:MAG: alpha/beta hydrolase [Vicingaceae bacterium]